MTSPPPPSETKETTREVPQRCAALFFGRRSRFLAAARALSIQFGIIRALADRSESTPCFRRIGARARNPHKGPLIDRERAPRNRASDSREARVATERVARPGSKSTGKLSAAVVRVDSQLARARKKHSEFSRRNSMTDGRTGGRTAKRQRPAGISARAARVWRQMRPTNLLVMLASAHKAT